MKNIHEVFESGVRTLFFKQFLALFYFCRSAILPKSHKLMIFTLWKSPVLCDRADLLVMFYVLSRNSLWEHLMFRVIRTSCAPLSQVCMSFDMSETHF